VWDTYVKHGAADRSTSATATTTVCFKIGWPQAPTQNSHGPRKDAVHAGCENTSKNDPQRRSDSQVQGECRREAGKLGMRDIAALKSKSARHRGKVQPADRTAVPKWKKLQASKFFWTPLDESRCSDHQLCECELTVERFTPGNGQSRRRSLRPGSGRPGPQYPAQTRVPSIRPIFS